MKNILLLLCSAFATSFICTAQKKNYLSVESGVYYGNANSKIKDGMISSGFDDTEVLNFLWLFSVDTKFPRKKADKSSYRIKYGHYLNNKTAIEAGFGLSYYGYVKGYDLRDYAQSNYLTLTSNINTLYIAWIKTDSLGKAGFGIGPALSIYKLTTDINQGTDVTSKNYLLPGVMLKGFWHFISFPSWYAGMATELSFTTPATINAIKIQTPTSESTFKAAKAGSFNGNVSLTAGFRF